MNPQQLIVQLIEADIANRQDVRVEVEIQVGDQTHKIKQVVFSRGMCVIETEPVSDTCTPAMAKMDQAIADLSETVTRIKEAVAETGLIVGGMK